MSIIQGIIGSIQGAGGGGASKSISNVWYTVGSSEGYTTDINIDYNNWDGSNIYWQVVGKGGTPGTAGTDFTGSLSGAISPTGTGTWTVTSVSFVADSETEGDEGWGVDVGSYNGANDYWNGTTWTISDISTSPAGKGYGAVSGSLNWDTNGSYISFSDASLAPGTGEFAFEALVNIRAQADGGNYIGGGFILGCGDENTWTDGSGLNIWVDSGWLFLNCCGTNGPQNSGYGGSYDLTSYIGQWIRLAVVRTTGGYIRTFINGTNLGTWQATGDFTRTQLDLGVQRRLINFGAGYNFKGLMTNIHWNTDAGYVNNKFNTNGNIANESTTLLTSTTGTKFLLNATTSSTKFTDSSSNNLTAIVTSSGPSWSNKSSYLVPYLWLDADSSESYPGSGSKWYSLGSGDKHATLIGSPQAGTAGSSSTPCLTFNQAGQYARGPNLGQDFYNTVSVWVYLNGNTWPPATGQQPAFITEEYTSSGQSIAFNLGTDTTTWNNSKVNGSMFNGSNWVASDTTFTPSTGTWYMFTLTQGENSNASAPAQRFYVNGSLVGSGTASALTTSGLRYFINKRWDMNETYDASYAVVQKFNQALDATQVAALYNAQKARFGY